MAEIDSQDVLIFVYERGEAGYTDLLDNFVLKGKCAKQTLINYKKELEVTGQLKKRISEKTGRPTYYVPRKFEDEVKVLIEKRRTIESLQKAPIDLAMRAEGSFYLPSLLGESGIFPLNKLELLDHILSIKGSSYSLPKPNIKYSLLHHIGREGKELSEEIKLFLKMRAKIQLDRMISNILTGIVMGIDDKAPQFIANLDELIDWYRDALNQRAIVTVEFDGKSLAEKIDWESLKKEVKQVSAEWDRTIIQAIEEGVDKGLGMRQELEKHPKEYEEFLSRLKEGKLKVMISMAILECLSSSFMSREMAIRAVIDVMKDEKKMRGLVPEYFQVPLQGVDLEEAVKYYLNDPESDYTMMLEKYNYPGTDRWYDLYCFARRTSSETDTQKD